MPPTIAVQQSLFGGGTPALGKLSDLRRIDLDADAWVEHAPDWLAGQDVLMAELVRTTAWHEEQRAMYDRVVTVPRLLAGLPKDGPGHPLLFQLRDQLAARYDVAFPRVTMAYYRSGDDSVAWHGDTIARELPTALVATLSLGGPRKFLLRPKARAGGRTRTFWLGQGDLLVMGGTCQRTWEHSIPKTSSLAPPRLAVMYRPIWTRPDARPSEAAP